jgi:uncharacterized protein (DUF4415 family)
MGTKKPKNIQQADWDAIDSPPLTDSILAAMRPASETFPKPAAASAQRKRGQRGPQKKPRRITVQLRLDREVIDAYKAAGKGYQTRMAAVLAKNAR